MGMHTFVRPPLQQIALSEYELKEIAAKRQSNPNSFTFDSSPQYSIPKRLGFEPVTFRLELIESTPRHRKFNVYGASAAGQPEIWKGTLTSETPEEWRRRMSTSY
jgi:hypothetical protein